MQLNHSIDILEHVKDKLEHLDHAIMFALLCQYNLEDFHDYRVKELIQRLSINRGEPFSLFVCVKNHMEYSSVCISK